MTLKELNTNLTTPEIFEHFQNQPYSFFLDSADQTHEFSRYSFIGTKPFLIFKSKGEEIEVYSRSKKTNLKGNPWEILQNLFSEYQKKNSIDKFPSLGIARDGELAEPFSGGAVGYFSYDLGRHLEDLPEQAIDDLDLPECYLGFYDNVIVFDHWEKKSWICSTGLREKVRGIEEKIFKPAGKINRSPRKKIIRSSPHPQFVEPQFVSNFIYTGYLQAVKEAKDYIAAGDIYQVNLSQRFMGTAPFSPWEVYKTLRAINPAPFACYLNFPEIKIVSASPERFLRISGRYVQTRPIKGTRPRGKNSFEDKKLAEELLTSKKDRAELVMIVDLERNDLGRVCEYGTVRVPKLITLEKHPTVYHLVGTVEGILREDKTHLDCLKACFPGGSISGAPKIRSMEIIEELEPTRRSIYTGSIGYLGFNGESDLNIVIRTLIFTKGKVYFQVGGGIVADSDPKKEYQETLDKGKALFVCLSPNEEKVSPSLRT